MFYTVYKITNLINNKIYIGCHKTLNLDDEYMGSGKILHRAFAKHGIENFKKEILSVFDNKEEMFKKEKELVFVNESTYNIKEGGCGGFDFININKLNKSFNWLKSIKSEENRKKVSEGLKKYRKSLSEEEKTKQKEKRIKGQKKYFQENGSWWNGKKHKESTKKKQSETHKGKYVGEKNNNYGKCWINNGIENKTIKKETLDEWILKGYKKGMRMDLFKG